ncbi:hypothetical protein GFY24_05550 [Nocardia sp. SYP-A9097]|uniref:alpha/beta hydrolase family protein n=1 Tax=Nocardia sp. SYP-A9097 TaxID=2663237 RepID=UPI00129AFF7A|nr:hypothetical protein [Nocardia sp. SYP-A9097]MRH86936.1 hypothetical protein [Nocardia sp. SYP-A9097]
MIGRIAAAALTTAALLTTGTAVSAAAPVGVTVLPRPSGQFQVGTTTLHLVDQGRPDPFQPDRPRELMVSVFYPAMATERFPRAHYVSTELVPDIQRRLGIELPGLLTNSYTDAPALRDGRFPVVLYTPGAGVSRLLGTGLAEDLASRGYVVVTMDHTYEGPAVEFPGGRITSAAPMPEGFVPSVRKKYIAARLLDIRFVVDSLTRLAAGTDPDAENRWLPTGLAGALDPDRIGIVGHSSGGYAAVEAMHDDRRISAAVDLDGQIGVDEDFGQAATEGVDRPVLVMTSRQIEEVGDANPSLDAFWQHGTGWKRQLTMSNSAHYDYTDMPTLVPDAVRPAAKTYFGPIPAARAADLTHTYVSALFDKFLRNDSNTALDHPGTDPEITTLR